MGKNIILAAYSLLKTRITGKRIPFIVGWSLTNRCDCQCSYCGRWHADSEELTTNQIFSIIEELSALGTYSINFTGGEPLLRDDIGKIIDYVKHKGMRAILTSNGSLIPQKINEIKQIDTLILSYDGPQEVHDQQRQKGSYQQVVKAIEIVKSYNIPIKLQTVLTKYNIDYINAILEFAKKFNVVISFQPVRFLPYIRKEDIEFLLPSIEKYKSAISNLIAERRKGNKYIGMSLRSLNYLNNLMGRSNKKIHCCAGILYCRIETNGDLYPCSNLIFNYKTVNCVKEGFKNAFLKMKPRTDYCNSFCCSNRLDLNSIYSFDLEAILCMKRIFKL